MHILSTQSPCVHTLSRNLVKSSKWICAGSFDLVQYWLSGDLFDLNWAYWPKWTISTFLLRQGRITMSKLYCQTLFRKNLCCFDALYGVLLQYVLLYCNLCNFVAIYAVLSRFTLFCWNLRCFVATTQMLQNTRSPRHSWGWFPGTLNFYGRLPPSCLIYKN